MLSESTYTLKWVAEKREGLPLLISVPDVGLVSLLTAINIINQLELPVVGYLDTKWLPSVVSVFEGEPLPPIRLYSNEKLMVFISEVPIEPENWASLSHLISSLYDELKTPFIFGVTGLSNPKRHSLKKLRLFVTYTNATLREKFLKEVIAYSGLLAGPYAAVIKSLKINDKDGLLLLVDSFPNYPDPEAAAVSTEAIEKIVGEKIDVSTLLEKASQIKLMARKLAAETRRVHSEAGVKTGRPAVSFYV